MPNPFTSRPLNTSHQTDRQAHVPVPEQYAGQNLPYRGVVNHGVNVPLDPIEPADWTDGRPVEYDAPPEDVPVVPVRIVSEASHEVRRFRTYTTYAGGTDYGRARQIVGQDEERATVTIKNRTVDQTVWLGHTMEAATEMGGYPLSAGQSITLTTHTGVFATAESAGDVKLHVLIEYASAT